jgi:hypothetical protein
MAVLSDLQKAIYDVLSGAYPIEENDMEYTVPVYTLRILQAEYNINFVEPEEVQLSVIPDK